EVFDDLADTEPLFQLLWDHFARPESWRLFDDAEPAWREARRRGLTVGIASNFDNRLPQVVGGLPLLSHCRHVYHSAAIGYAKPDVRFFRAVERQLKLAPEQILLVGDHRQFDYHGA